MMKRLLIVLCATLPAIPLAACAGGYGYGGGVGYAATPYAYNGYYDDYYGQIYDGYWGDDGGFYYRRGAHERSFRRGDPAHFNQSSAPGEHFHQMQGSLTPGRGMRMPHFAGGGDHGAHH